MVTELFYRKNKNNTYEAYDRQGHSVTAGTKELAKRKWYATFGVDRKPQNCVPDLSKYNISI